MKNNLLIVATIGVVVIAIYYIVKSRDVDSFHIKRMGSPSYKSCVADAQQKYTHCNGTQNTCINDYTSDIYYCISPSGQWPSCVDPSALALNFCLNLYPKNVEFCTSQFNQSLACANINV